LWMNSTSKNPVSIALRLGDIDTAETKAGFIGFSSPKITLHLKHLPSSTITTTTTTTISSSLPICMLSFHGHERDAFAIKLDQTLKQKSWIVVEEKVKPKDDFSTSSAGIRGIIRKVEVTQKQREVSASEAFGDLDQLIKNAEQIVKLAEQYTTSKEHKSSEKKKSR